jgi:hypothetical protein
MSRVAGCARHGVGLGCGEPPFACVLCGLGWLLAWPGGVWLDRGPGDGERPVATGDGAAVGLAVARGLGAAVSRVGVAPAVGRRGPGEPAGPADDGVAPTGAALGCGASTAAGLACVPVAVRSPGAPGPGSTGPRPGTASRDSDDGATSETRTTPTYVAISTPSATKSRCNHRPRRPEASTKTGRVVPAASPPSCTCPPSR